MWSGLEGNTPEGLRSGGWVEEQASMKLEGGFSKNSGSQDCLREVVCPWL